MPEQPRHLANKYEDIVNLPGAGAYFGGFPRSLWIAQQYVTYYHAILPILSVQRPLQNSNGNLLSSSIVVVLLVVVVVVVNL